MRHFVRAAALLVSLALAACGGGGGGSGSTPPHPLEGTWLGGLVDTGVTSMRIDAAGVISDITTSDPNPSIVLLDGVVEGGPPVYTFRMRTVSVGTVTCVFLVDADARHGTFGALGPSAGHAILMFGVLERGAASRPSYFQPDIWGDWSGYGYAYSPPDLGFATFSPVTATASDGTPSDPFEVTLPGGSFQGVLDGTGATIGVWSGIVPATSARFTAAMSSDKLFLAVLAVPGTPTSVHDLSFYALNRD